MGNMRIKKVEHLTALFHWIRISRILTSFEQIYAVRHPLYSTIFFGADSIRKAEHGFVKHCHCMRSPQDYQASEKGSSTWCSALRPSTTTRSEHFFHSSRSGNTNSTLTPYDRWHLKRCPRAPNSVLGCGVACGCRYSYFGESLPFLNEESISAVSVNNNSSTAAQENSVQNKGTSQFPSDSASKNRNCHKPAWSASDPNHLRLGRVLVSATSKLWFAIAA